MLLHPVARGSRRCSEKKKWEDASRDEINTAKQIASRLRGHVMRPHRSMHHTSSRLMQVGKQDLAAPSMTVDDCGSKGGLETSASCGSSKIQHAQPFQCYEPILRVDLVFSC